MSSGVARPAACPRGPAEATGRAQAWLEGLAQDVGEKLPVACGRVREERDAEELQSGEVRLPYTTKKDVYEEYTAHCGINGEKRVSETQFYRLWRRAELTHVKISKPKGSFAMCNTCSEFGGYIKRAENNTDAEYWRGKRREHLALQSEQRMEYYRNCNRAMTAKHTYLSVIIDAMDQAKTQLPLVNRRMKSDRIHLIKQKVMGVIAHGHGFYLYVGHPPLRMGANFTLECLWRTLMKLDARYKQDGGRLPPNISIQMDNASDNKSYAMLAFASHLVDEGVFEHVELIFFAYGACARGHRPTVFSYRPQVQANGPWHQKQQCGELRRFPGAGCGGVFGKT